MQTPADPETLAHNQRKEAERNAGPARVESLLRELAPQVFCDAPMPLAVGIFAALKELLAGEADDATIGRFLRDRTSRPAYLVALARGDARRGLEWETAGTPSDDDRRWAAIRLRHGLRAGAWR